MLLHDHACRASRKGVAGRREVGASDRLCDRACDRTWHVDSLKVMRAAVRRRGTFRRWFAPFIAKTARTLPTRSTTAKFAGRFRAGPRRRLGR